MSRIVRILYLARHGETDWNVAGRWQGRTDIPLSDRGRAQARALGARLNGLGIGHIRASDLSRAQETATIVAQALGVPDVTVDPDLRERSFGVFEGLTRQECAARYPDLWALYEQGQRVSPPGAEPHAQVIARMTEALRRATTLEHAAASPMLIVGHGGALRVLLGHTTGRAFPPIGNAGLFRLVLERRQDADHVAEVEDLGPTDPAE